MPSIPPPSATGAPNIGEVLADKYRVERVLGSGAMGVVVAALHLELGEHVALKFLLPQAATNPEVVARFGREARAAARIKSEYVARVTDVGKLDNGAPYMVMEYLDGNDLAAVVSDRRTLTVRDAVEYVLQACAAVAEAHALGIIHRDLKPANLFLANRAGGSPIVKVLDFGISKIVPVRGADVGFDPSTTRTTAWLGSPLYMSPEQMTSAKNVDTRTDIWSLGAILFELLTGKPPFDAVNLPELFATILNSPPPELEPMRPDAPPGLGAVIKKCLSRSLDERYGSVADLALALAPFAPRRARTVAERAVAVSEAAGIKVSRVNRRPLDATMPEDLVSPIPRVPAHPSEPLQTNAPGQSVAPPASMPPGSMPPRGSNPMPQSIPPAPLAARMSIPATPASLPPSVEKVGKSSTAAVMMVFVAAGLAATGAYFFAVHLKGQIAPAASATASAAPPSSAVMPSAVATASAEPPSSAAPTPSAAPSALAVPVSAAIDAGAVIDAGSVKDAGGAHDAGALFGRIPKAIPHESATAAPAPAPTPVQPVAPPPPPAIPDGL